MAQERSAGSTDLALPTKNKSQSFGGQVIILVVGSAIALAIMGAIAFVWGSGWIVLSVANLFGGLDEPDITD